jgi:hypothetical protein
MNIRPLTLADLVLCNAAGVAAGVNPPPFPLPPSVRTGVLVEIWVEKTTGMESLNRKHPLTDFFLESITWPALYHRNDVEVMLEVNLGTTDEVVASKMRMRYYGNTRSIDFMMSLYVGKWVQIELREAT